MPTGGYIYIYIRKTRFNHFYSDLIHNNIGCDRFKFESNNVESNSDHASTIFFFFSPASIYTYDVSLSFHVRFSLTANNDLQIYKGCLFSPMAFCIDYREDKLLLVQIELPNRILSNSRLLLRLLTLFSFIPLL